jgi:hypothetical protein
MSAWSCSRRTGASSRSCSATSTTRIAPVLPVAPPRAIHAAIRAFSCGCLRRRVLAGGRRVELDAVGVLRRGVGSGQSDRRRVGHLVRAVPHAFGHGRLPRAAVTPRSLDAGRRHHHRDPRPEHRCAVPIAEHVGTSIVRGHRPLTTTSCRWVDAVLSGQDCGSPGVLHPGRPGLRVRDRHDALGWSERARGDRRPLRAGLPLDHGRGRVRKLLRTRQSDLVGGGGRRRGSHGGRRHGGGRCRHRAGRHPGAGRVDRLLRGAEHRVGCLRHVECHRFRRRRTGGVDELGTVRAALELGGLPLVVRHALPEGSRPGPDGACRGRRLRLGGLRWEQPVDGSGGRLPVVGSECHRGRRDVSVRSGQRGDVERQRRRRRGRDLPVLRRSELATGRLVLDLHRQSLWTGLPAGP